MDNEPAARIELMNSLLLSFPGTPIIYYGDEIGMGDNIYLGDRKRRAPHADAMELGPQWRPFSRADPARLYAPMIMDPVYGYEAVNVEAQSRQPVVRCSAPPSRLVSVRQVERWPSGRGQHGVHPPGQSLPCSPMSGSTRTR